MSSNSIGEHFGASKKPCLDHFVRHILNDPVSFDDFSLCHSLITIKDF